MVCSYSSSIFEWKGHENIHKWNDQQIIQNIGRKLIKYNFDWNLFKQPR